jgi:probable F420-dependent oxidoreductase
VKFGFILPNFGDKISAADLVKISLVCEEEGFDSVWATDHILLPAELREPYGQLIEPLITLSFVAAATSRLKVGTSSLVLPQRNPILVAKQAAAVDVFSGGRVILGFGIGWAEKEFAFLGADFKRRARVMDESIRLIRKLWSEDIVNFDGKYFRVKDALFLPKPAHGTIPIWVAGNSEGALQRAIRVGDGWHPVGLDLERYRDGAERISKAGRKLTLSARMTVDVRKKRVNAVGRDGERRTTFSGSPSEIRKSIDDYASAGMEYCCAAIMHPSSSEIIEDIKNFSSNVIRSYV